MEIQTELQKVSFSEEDSDEINNSNSCDRNVTENGTVIDCEYIGDSGTYFESVVFQTGKLSPLNDFSGSEEYEDVVIKVVPNYENVHYDTYRESKVSFLEHT